MANYLVNDTDLAAVADAIRAKARAEGALEFPDGFVSTISGIPEKAAATYNTSSSDQTIAADQYLAGAQTIRGVTTENISAGNIKNGVTVKVGDAGSAGRIKNVTGTLRGALGTREETSILAPVTVPANTYVYDFTKQVNAVSGADAYLFKSISMVGGQNVYLTNVSADGRTVSGTIIRTSGTAAVDLYLSIAMWAYKITP